MTRASGGSAAVGEHRQAPSFVTTSASATAIRVRRAAARVPTSRRAAWVTSSGVTPAGTRRARAARAADTPASRRAGGQVSVIASQPAAAAGATRAPARQPRVRSSASAAANRPPSPASSSASTSIAGRFGLPGRERRIADDGGKIRVRSSRGRRWSAERQPARGRGGGAGGSGGAPTALALSSRRRGPGKLKRGPGKLNRRQGTRSGETVGEQGGDGGGIDVAHDGDDQARQRVAAAVTIEQREAAEGRRGVGVVAPHGFRRQRLAEQPQRRPRRAVAGRASSRARASCARSAAPSSCSANAGRATQSASSARPRPRCWGRKSTRNPSVPGAANPFRKPPIAWISAAMSVADRVGSPAPASWRSPARRRRPQIRALPTGRSRPPAPRRAARCRR